MKTFHLKTHRGHVWSVERDARPVKSFRIRFGLIDFPARQFIDLLMELGEVFPLDEAFDELFEVVLSVAQKRDSRLGPGALIVADNMIFPESSREAAAAYQKHIRSKPGIQSLLLPVGFGLELSRYR